MSTADKLTTIAENVPKVYQAGFGKGVADGEAICASKHFVSTFTGYADDPRKASFHVPFDPDALFVFCSDPRAIYVPYTLLYSALDRSAFGYIAGGTFYSTGVDQQGIPSLKNQAHPVSGVRTRCSRSSDGTITLDNMGGTSANSPAICFSAGFVYSAVAVKYTEQTDKDRIKEFVNSLTGTGTVQLDEAKVGDAFTTEEWKNLIATQRDWTFSLK